MYSHERFLVHLMLFYRNAGESASCTVIFVIIYYFTMAGVVWFAILAYTWHRTFRSFNSKRDVIDGHKGYFHLAAWCLPLVLTIVCLAVTQVCMSDSWFKITVLLCSHHTRKPCYDLLFYCLCICLPRTENYSICWKYCLHELIWKTMYF